MEFDWTHLFRTKTSQKSFLKTFCYNNKSTRKVKYFQQISNEEFFYFLWSNNTK